MTTATAKKPAAETAAKKPADTATVPALDYAKLSEMRVTDIAFAIHADIATGIVEIAKHDKAKGKYLAKKFNRPDLAPADSPSARRSGAKIGETVSREVTVVASKGENDDYQSVRCPLPIAIFGKRSKANVTIENNKRVVIELP